MMKSNTAPIMSSPKRSAFKFPSRPKPIMVFIIAVLFTLLSVWAQGSEIARSGLRDQEGNLLFNGYVLFHDSNVHLSLIAEMRHRFPPTNFAAGGTTPLKNYHYLFDAGVALISKVSPFSVLDLYFRIIPAVISVSLAAAVYFTTKRLTGNTLCAATAIFFTIFGTGFGTLDPSFWYRFGLHPNHSASNLFMTDQLLGMMVNPQALVGLILFLVIFLLLSKYQETGRVGNLVLMALLLGLSFGIKAYGGIVMLPAVLLAGVWQLIFRRDQKILWFGIFGGIVMGIWFFLTIDRGVAGLQFAPFWLLDKMMIDLDRLNTPRFLIARDQYLLIHSYWRLIILYSYALLFYLVGSLGIRLMGIISLVAILKKTTKITAAEAFLLCAGFISLLIPLFFNQMKKAYDVVQFTPYFTTLMGIMFTVAVFKIISVGTGKSKALLLGLLVIFVLWSDREELSSRWQPNREPIVIPRKVLAAVDYVKTKTPPSAVFYLPPNDFNRRYLWFSSLAERRTIGAGEDFNQQVGAVTPPSANYDYLFFLRPEAIDFAKMVEAGRFKIVFENESALVFEREN